jgi:hypothetical protein
MSNIYVIYRAMNKINELLVKEELFKNSDYLLSSSPLYD